MTNQLLSACRLSEVFREIFQALEEDLPTPYRDFMLKVGHWIEDKLTKLVPLYVHL